ncbi:MAG: Crp/Fnr family transcriptional regulator [Pseudomonadota bacterium]
MSPAKTGGRAAAPLTPAQRSLAGRLPFAGLSDAQRAEMVRAATLHPLRTGDTCFAQGAQAHRFFVLLDGALKLVRTTDRGEHVVLLHIAPAQLFGIAAAFGHDTHHAAAHAVTEGRALSWPASLWARYIRDYPGFNAASRTALGSRNDAFAGRIIDMATLPVERRIARAIRGLIARYGRQAAGGIEIGFPITRQDIAELTGTTLHSVSRYMSQWQRAGIVENHRKRVIVRRAEDLPV